MFVSAFCIQCSSWIVFSKREAALTTEERLNTALIPQTVDKPITDEELGLAQETPQLSISDFKKNPEVVERAIRAMSYVDGTTYDDGSKASDRFVDYARDADFNLTQGAFRLANILSQQKKQSPVKQFLVFLVFLVF